MLSGCTTKEFHLGWYDKCLPKTVIEIKREYPEIDDSLLTCPKIPKPKIMTKQSEVSLFLVELTSSGKECKTNLKDVRMLLNKFNEDKNSSK